jgi:hypothetical protein
LAGKVEETPKKCKDIIKTARSLLTDQKFLTFGEDPKVVTPAIYSEDPRFKLDPETNYSEVCVVFSCFRQILGSYQTGSHSSLLFVIIL